MQKKFRVAPPKSVVYRQFSLKVGLDIAKVCIFQVHLVLIDRCACAWAVFFYAKSAVVYEMTLRKMFDCWPNSGP